MPAIEIVPTGAIVDNTLIVAVGLVFGASVLRPRWTATIYSTKGLFVGFVGFGAILLRIREQRRRYGGPPRSLGYWPMAAGSAISQSCKSTRSTCWDAAALPARQPEATC